MIFHHWILQPQCKQSVLSLFCGRSSCKINIYVEMQEMSYNNYLDADAAWNCVCEFNNPTCVVVKHTNPCGVASVGPNTGLLEAYRLAVRADPVSAFGGIVAFNVEVDEVWHSI